MWLPYFLFFVMKELSQINPNSRVFSEEFKDKGVFNFVMILNNQAACVTDSGKSFFLPLSSKVVFVESMNNKYKYD